MKSLNASFSTADRILLGLGGLGVLIFFVLLPHVHPDAAVRFDIKKEEAIDIAKSFARLQGQSPGEMNWRARPVRTIGLLDSILAQTGSRSMYRIDSAFASLPAYQWSVTGQRETENEGKATEIHIKLDASGKIWHFTAPTASQQSPFPAALRQAPSLLGIDSLENQLNDPATRYRWAIEPERNLPPRSDSITIVGLTAEDAQAIARYHLESTLLSDFDVSIDSVYRPRNLPPRLVRVHLTATEPGSGIELKSNLDINTSGRLASMVTSFAPNDGFPETGSPGIGAGGPPPVPPRSSGNEGNNSDFSFDLEDAPYYLMLGAYFVLGIFILVLFLRRLSARLIDVKSALQDSIWGGLFAAVYMGNMEGWNLYNDASSIWSGLLQAVGVMLLFGTLGAFVVFILSSATDSIARVIWPNKLLSLSLARNARFLNTSMGLSSLRAVGLAGLCLGISTLFLYLPGVVFVFTEEMEQLLGHNTLSPLASVIASFGWKSMLITMSILLGLGTALYGKRQSRILLIIMIALLSALLQIGPLTVKPIAWQWLLSGTIGLALVTVFLQFDFMSAFTGFLLFGALWEIAPSWFISVSEARVDALLAFALIPGMLVLGFIGLRSKKVEEDAGLFMPTYLREMARQERLQSELEIAKQVQASLLPRRMPIVKGLDIAAMCLPAEEVGGDYFDFIHLDDHRLAVVVGDVSGKGIQAAFYMTLTKGFIHAMCNDLDSPAALLTRVNRLFCKNVARGTFISLIYGVLDTHERTFTFARAGHDPLLYRSASNGEPTFLKPPGLAIGLTPTRTFDDTIRDLTIKLAPNDVLVFYTDGITEATNLSREQFGGERLAREVSRSSLPLARQILDDVSNYIHMFIASAGRIDDMTMIVLRFAGDDQQLAGSIISSAMSTSWLEHQSQSLN